jgi:glycosyltransferase involved in cell wall biosynthesis
MPDILHCISAYPDPVAPETQASSLLLALTAKQFSHHVFSFKRAGWRGDITAIAFGDDAGADHRAMVYGAPPKGLRLGSAMRDLAMWIIADAQKRGIKPDIVHAHKVSMDGLVGAKVAAHFGVPLALSVQANTDTRIIGTRRDLRDTYRALWQEAAVVFPFAPAALHAVTPLLGTRTGTVQVLPCPTRADGIMAPSPRAQGRAPVILTAFHLAHYVNKNIEALLQATVQAARAVPGLRLDIIGGGDAAAFLTVSEMVRRIAPDNAQLLGARGGNEMQARMNAATAFAMMSHRESFGMVYSESLLAGTPCLHSSGRAIDGLLPEGEMTLGVDPKDVDAMAAALVRLCSEEAAFKGRIAAAQKAGTLEFLRRDHIAQTYGERITGALGSTPPSAA